jgi:hypothetical protein
VPGGSQGRNRPGCGRVRRPPPRAGYERGARKVRLKSAAGAGLGGTSPARKSADAADGVDGLAEVAGQEAGGDGLPYGPGLDHAVATGYLDASPAAAGSEILANPLPGRPPRTCARALADPTRPYPARNGKPQPLPQAARCTLTITPPDRTTRQHHDQQQHATSRAATPP